MHDQRIVNSSILPLLLAAVLAGCATSTSPESSIVKLVGDWSQDDGRHLLRLNSDGTFAVDDGGALESNPDDVGTFSFDGEILTFTSSEESRFCKAGDLWIWELEFVGDDQIRGVVTVDDCSSFEGRDWTWTRCVAEQVAEGRISCEPVK